MVKTVSKQNSAEADLSGKMPGCQLESKGIAGISCIWCYLVATGAKKAYKGISQTAKRRD